MAPYGIDLPSRLQATFEFGLDFPSRHQATVNYDVDKPSRLQATINHGTDKPSRLQTTTGYGKDSPSELNTSNQFGQDFVSRLQATLEYGVDIEAYLATETSATLPPPTELGDPDAPSPTPVAVPQIELRAPLVTILNLTSGGSYRWESVAIGRTVNQGWHGNVQIAYLEDLEFSEETLWKIILDDGTASEETPPLIAVEREGGWDLSGDIAQFDLIDQTMWKLSKPGMSLPTFLSTTNSVITSSGIASTVGSTAGVQIVGFPSFPVMEEDIKQSKGLDPLLRMLAVAAYEFVIRQDSKLSCFPFEFKGARFTPPFDTARMRRDASKRITQMRFEKTSRITGRFCFPFNEAKFHTVAFPYPLYGAAPSDESSSGFITYVATFNGDPSSGTLIKFWVLAGVPPNIGVPEVGVGLSTHATIVVEPPANPEIEGFNVDAVCCFSGVPEGLPPGVETNFAFTYGTPERPADSPWTEALMPSQSYMAARAQPILWMRSKGWKTLSVGGPLYLGGDLLMEMAIPRFPVARVEQIQHQVSANQAQTSYEGFVVPW